MPHEYRYSKTTEEEVEEGGLFKTDCKKRRSVGPGNLPKAGLPGDHPFPTLSKSHLTCKKRTDPYAHLEFVGEDWNYLPISEKETAEELNKSSLNEGHFHISAKSPLTDLVYLHRKNQSISTYIKCLKHGPTGKGINSLICRALTRELLSIVHQKELYLGQGLSANLDTVDLLRNLRSKDWFETAAIPILRRDLITPITSAMAENLNLACAASRFGHTINQGVIDKY